MPLDCSGDENTIIDPNQVCILFGHPAIDHLRSTHLSSILHLLLWLIMRRCDGISNKIEQQVLHFFTLVTVLYITFHLRHFSFSLTSSATLCCYINHTDLVRSLIARLLSNLLTASSAITDSWTVPKLYMPCTHIHCSCKSFQGADNWMLITVNPIARLLSHAIIYHVHQASERGVIELPLIMGVNIDMWPLILGVFGLLPLILGVTLLLKQKWQHCYVSPGYQLEKHQQRLIQCGGWRRPPLTYANVQPYLRDDALSLGTHVTFCVVDHVSRPSHQQYTDGHYLYVDIPLDILVQFVPVTTARKIACLHGINLGSHASTTTLKQHLKEHICGFCAKFITVLSIQNRTPKECADHAKTETLKPELSHSLLDEFPPPPINQIQSHQIIQSACTSMDKRFIEEAGCAVCGQLTRLTDLSQLSAMKNHLHVLTVPGITKQERKTVTDKVQDLAIVIDNSCDQVCLSCRAALRKNRMPQFALARGLWIGTVPPELSSLRYIERMLVARVRHSCCCVRIASGMRKMKANAVAFRSPTPKIYNILPPPREDIQEVLAIMFTGPCKPTATDFNRTPFLVRRNHVKRALEWLALNHIDYTDILISDKNLSEYPENMPPVSVEYKKMESNKTPESVSLFDIDVEDGTQEGDCPFTVHGITGEEMDTLSTNALKAKALQHLNTQGKMLAVGHSESAETIWRNPQLYPQMFPWLFPYGLGGIGSVAKISEKQHTKQLLMYHDKRFQTDPNFPFMAFSHEQIKASTTRSFLLAEKHMFRDMTDRLLAINSDVLSTIIQKIAQEESVQPQTTEEKQCFQLLRDLDHVQGALKGTNTSKKWMRNEIWSLVYHCGAPFWYITLSPADVKHPICIYFANTQAKFEPTIISYEDRLRMVCRNPVACARFFHYIVTIFIKDVLGVEAKHTGAYGPVNAYYGTVEQQGRLALHLHMAVWLKGNLTPQNMRQSILDPQSEFRQKIITWLESCHMGEFITGSQNDVLLECSRAMTRPEYQDPTESMPAPPPPLCGQRHANKNKKCQTCGQLEEWWEEFDKTVDDIVGKSNIHNCNRGINWNGVKNQKTMFVGCRDNKYGKCKARFPRMCHEKTQVDSETGAITLKKLEPWINTFTPLLTYLMRCNTDVTCIWSGTAMKAVLVYITDYITKTGLKTHVVFETIKSVFDKHRDTMEGTIPEKEKARVLINKIVNLLSTKLEMGAPMVCMYLLDNPDHYTGHNFVPFYWETFVKEAQSAWDSNSIKREEQKVTIIKQRGKIIGLSPVYDYMYRPTEIQNMCLYDWIRRCERKTFKSIQSNTKKKTRHKGDDSNTSEDNDTSDASDETSKQAESISRLPKNMYRYSQEHPLCDTHGTIVKGDNPKTVVNFIGKPLPRCNQGDREYYCLVMLALFKPWRSGLCLKHTENSWHETFNSHEFTVRQEQLIQNFNIKYECLDARDDFSAQLRKEAETDWRENKQERGEQKGTAGEDMLDEMDPEHIEGHLHNQERDFSILGATELRRQQETRDIRLIMERTGWTETLQMKEPIAEEKPINARKRLSGIDWKNKIQQLRQKTLEDRQTRQVTASSDNSKIHLVTPNVVKIVDRSHLEQKSHAKEHKDTISKLSMQLKLNKDQDRAFKIVANHLVLPFSEQLKMYIGGMGGTGKSQVIKAITLFFAERNESQRFLIVAPTGTAAALLAGSTYHSVLGINEKTGNASAKMLAQVRTRLTAVDYIFLDEVSMLSSHDLYRISAQLCKVMNKHETAFGGINMIFAGDFGQLPPAMGGENVSLYSRQIGKSATTVRAQEEAIGRALWHQVTTVVILRENMRQKTSSDQDDKLRTALANMRYKDCTTEDIQFLHSRISSFKIGQVSICDAKFSNVAIITAKNVQKDEINRLGCIRFATQTCQKLTDFYSEDILKIQNENRNGPKKWRKGMRQLETISDSLQKTLWEMPHASADRHIAGKLSLCIGLPVMIKCNVATELCITNGQEATVMGWQSHTGSKGQVMLETLFVKLQNPPTEIQIEGLPKNTVPLTYSTNNITCSLPDDSKIQIARTQVEVLPNFAMTDYASQGKTRPHNPVDVNNCRSHQAYYTALSRSATAAGTVILQGFDHRKITGKASGALRQEFRDLELLDEISKLRYESKLHMSVTGDRRNTLIQAYREHQGMSYVPATVHKSIRWTEKDPMLTPINDEMEWKIVRNDKKTNIQKTENKAKIKKQKKKGK